MNAIRERYAIAIVIIAVSIIIIAMAIASSFWSPLLIDGGHFVGIVIGSASIEKSTYTLYVNMRYIHIYQISINFTNTGTTSTSIGSVLLNGVPYNDSGWTGTLRPAVAGNLTPKSIINVGISNAGAITFSDDCQCPGVNVLNAGALLTITIRTTDGRDFNVDITLP